MFPSPVKEGEPLNPNGVYRKMVKILDRAQCKRVRFHDLRHTFATTALEHGMDIKTLSAIIGHVSSATTLDIYSHITDEMQANAANKIEKRFSKNEPFEQSEYETQKQAPSSVETFEPYKGKIRKSGTGGIYELNDHLFEGRYSPTNAYGKREVHTVYAKTREECERLLSEMIPKVRAEMPDFFSKNSLKKSGLFRFLWYCVVLKEVPVWTQSKICTTEIFIRMNAKSRRTVRLTASQSWCSGMTQSCEKRSMRAKQSSSASSRTHGLS